MLTIFIWILSSNRDYFDELEYLRPQSPPGESRCIKTGSQIGGWVFSSLDHVHPPSVHWQLSPVSLCMLCMSLALCMANSNDQWHLWTGF